MKTKLTLAFAFLFALSLSVYAQVGLVRGNYIFRQNQTWIHHQEDHSFYTSGPTLAAGDNIDDWFNIDLPQLIFFGLSLLNSSPDSGTVFCSWPYPDSDIGDNGLLPANHLAAQSLSGASRTCMSVYFSWYILQITWRRHPSPTLLWATSCRQVARFCLTGRSNRLRKPLGGILHRQVICNYSGKWFSIIWDVYLSLCYCSGILNSPCWFNNIWLSRPCQFSNRLFSCSCRRSLLASFVILLPPFSIGKLRDTPAAVLYWQASCCSCCRPLLASFVLPSRSPMLTSCAYIAGEDWRLCRFFRNFTRFCIIQ